MSSLARTVPEDESLYVLCSLSFSEGRSRLFLFPFSTPSLFLTQWTPSNINHTQNLPVKWRGVHVCVRLSVWGLSWCSVLTCFSTRVHCAASSLRNERVRNLPRILLQKGKRRYREKARSGEVGWGVRGEGRKRGIRNRALAFFTIHSSYKANSGF